MEYIGIYLVQVLYALPFVPPILALLIVQPMNANKLFFAAKKTIVDSPQQDRLSLLQKRVTNTSTSGMREAPISRDLAYTRTYSPIPATSSN